MKDTSVSFDHIHIISSDARSTAVWYVEKLDGKIIKDLEVQGAPQVFVRLGGIFLIIRGQRTGESAEDKNTLQWGMDHFGFSVDGDFDGYCTQLKERGVKFTLNPMNFSPTSRIAYIEDPDGIKIELLQRS
jgi:lactoylglutathione lyase